MKELIKYVSICIVITLLISCGQQVAGFGSETTNGGSSIIVSITGVSDFKGTKIMVLPSDYNPVEHPKSSIINANPDSNGKAKVSLVKGHSYSIYGADSITGKKVLLQNFIADGDTTLVGKLEQPGELRVNFVGPNGMVDTVNGYVAIGGYPEFGNSFVKNSSNTVSVSIKNVPQSLIHSVVYGVKRTSTQEIGKISDSIKVISQKTTDWNVQLYFRFLTKSNSPLLNDTVTVVTLGRESGLVWIGTNNGITSYKDNQFISRTTLNSQLKDNRITSVIESSDTVTWFGTINGLTRYTETNWATYYKSSNMLPSNKITKLASNRDAMVWIGTDSGLVLYKKDSIITYTKKYGLPSNVITALAIAPNGTLWGGTDSGAFCIDSTRKVRQYSQKTLPFMFLPIPYITTIEISKTGKVWLGTAGGGILTYEDGKIQRMDYSQSFNAVNYVTAIHSGLDGNVWFGTKSGILLKNNGDKWWGYRDCNGKSLPQAEILSFKVDEKGNFYCGTLGKGLFLLGPHAEKLLTN